MSEKSGEMPEEIQSRMIRDRHLWRGFSTDDDGGCTEKPDDVFEQGFEACYLFMIERETKLKEQLAETIAALKMVNKVGLTHYEDCPVNIDDCETCFCGIETILNQVWNAIEKASE